MFLKRTENNNYTAACHKTVGISVQNIGTCVNKQLKRLESPEICIFSCIYVYMFYLYFNIFTDLNQHIYIYIIEKFPNHEKVQFNKCQEDYHYNIKISLQCKIRFLPHNM